LSMAVDPTSSSIVYAGFAGIGILKSYDGGATWSPAGPLPSNLVTEIVIDRTSPNTVYATTLGGVFKSLDGGCSWNDINTGLSGAGYTTTLAIDPTNPSNLYLGRFYDRIWRSVDGGESWSPVSEGLPYQTVTSIAIDPTNPDHLWVGISSVGAFETQDGGATWEARNKGVKADFIPGPEPETYPQLLAAGDIADCTPPSEQTAQLLDQFPGTVTPLGDTAYPTGSYADFANCYDPTWGRHKYRTRPAVGSHEYETLGAVPYWDYFGPAAGEAGKGWYSYDLGSWHVIVLNSACSEVGGCGPGSPQMEWLQADLAANPAECTAAYWHIPRYSSGKKHGDDLNYVVLWEVLYEYGVEFVMGGNDHHYERYAPQTPYGDLDLTDGIRQFVVGTGGRFLRPVTETPPPNSEARDANTYGVLRVGLQDGAYEWEFVPVDGSTYTDSGTSPCH